MMTLVISSMRFLRHNRLNIFDSWWWLLGTVYYIFVQSCLCTVKENIKSEIQSQQPCLGMLNDNRIIDYRNLFSFSFLHYRFSKCAREYRIDCSRKRGAARVLIASWLLIYIAHARRFKPGSPPTQFTVIHCMSWSGRKLAGADTVHAFIYVRRWT